MGRLSALATRLISKHGRAVEILREGPGEPDGFGGFEPGPVTSFPAVALTATYADELQFIAGGLLSIGDQRVFIAADGLAIEPKAQDHLRMEGRDFRTIRVSPLSPDGSVIFWELQVRDDL